ncbi:TerD family protein [Streptomyces sp. NPDC059757]|uniref:TerD family protein n=1 Tax=Streptomyces sp. NPDC059757 TaxID=3346935 RepID=UPI00365C0874
MVKGANTELASLSEDVSSVVLSLAWCSATGDGDADVSVLLLDANGKVRSAADFFFYNNPAAADGSVQLLGKTPTADGSEDRITLDLSAMPSGVERVVVAASRYGDARFGDLDDLRIAIADRTGEALLGFSITDAGVESAFIFGELYRRGEEWKFRAVGQGYETGLAGLATDFGIDMDDASEDEPEEPVEGAEPSAVVVEAPAESPVHVPAQAAAPEATAARPRRPRTAKKKVTLPQTPRKSLAENDAWRGELALTEGPIDAVDADGDDGDDEADRKVVEHERTELREFIKGLSADDIKSGGWFTKLSAQAMSSYTEKVDWQYFQERYEGVPADAIVDQRMKMAARYAALEGGLSAGAYSAAVVATLGSLGGASPATVPAAVATMMVDVAFITRLQLRLAYDVAVLYRVPLELSDPDDMWKLIRVAFTIKSGEAVREGVVKAVPAIVRPAIKRFYSGGVLSAARGLPVVGKYLLQRNVIKIGIPLVGVPLAVVLNRYTTLLAGRHAQAVFRNEARVIELAEGMSKRSQHPQLMLWVAWLVIMADHKIADDEALLMRHLVRLVREKHQVVDRQLADLVDIDPAEVWGRIDAEPGDLSDILDVADRVATVDGAVNAHERAVISELRDRCRRA